MSRRISIAHLTAIDLSAPAFIEATATAGFDGVGLRLLRVSEDSPGYPLMDDTLMLRATRRAMDATGLPVCDIEFVKITPVTRPDDPCALLDTGAELGAGHVIAAPCDSDLARLSDTLGDLAERAAERGLGFVLEFIRWASVPDTATALAVVERAGPGVGVLVDSLHFDRSATTLKDLAAIPTSRLPLAHLCDAPAIGAAADADLMFTARQERLPPGEGRIDLAAFLGALPDGLPLAAEVPMTAHMRRVGAAQVLKEVAEASRLVVRQADVTR